MSLKSLSRRILGVLALILNVTAPKSVMPLRLKTPPLHRRPDRSKPRQPTIVRRRTLRSLRYLVISGLTPEIGSNLAVPHNLRERERHTGRFVCENVPTYGV